MRGGRCRRLWRCEDSAAVLARRRLTRLSARARQTPPRRVWSTGGTCCSASWCARRHPAGSPFPALPSRAALTPRHAPLERALRPARGARAGPGAGPRGGAAPAAHPPAAREATASARAANPLGGIRKVQGHREAQAQRARVRRGGWGVAWAAWVPPCRRRLRRGRRRGRRMGDHRRRGSLHAAAAREKGPPGGAGGAAGGQPGGCSEARRRKRTAARKSNPLLAASPAWRAAGRQTGAEPEESCGHSAPLHSIHGCVHGPTCSAHSAPPAGCALCSPQRARPRSTGAPCAVARSLVARAAAQSWVHDSA